MRGKPALTHCGYCHDSARTADATSLALLRPRLPASLRCDIADEHSQRATESSDATRLVLLRLHPLC